MEFTPEGVSALFAGMAIGGGAVKWFEDRRRAKRAAIPNIRAQWRGGSEGLSVTVTIANRLDEDIKVSTVEAKARMMDQINGEYDTALGSRTRTYVPTSRRESVDWHINAGETGKHTFFVEGASSPRWIRLTLSSNAKTIRGLRIVVEE